LIKTKHMQSESGSSILEIVVAMGILSIAMVTILSLFQISFAGNEEELRKTVAIHLARQQLEGVKSASFDSLTPGLTANVNVSLNGFNYRRQILVSEIDTGSYVYKEVYSQVYWPNRNKEERLVEIYTKRVKKKATP